MHVLLWIFRSERRMARDCRPAALLVAALLLSLACLAASPPTPKPAPLRFNRDIRPILTTNCFVCHGQDHTKRMAGLRLDIREQAIAKGVIVPGKPEKSPLVARIFATSDAVRMPPVASHKHLTEAEKQLLKRWIAEGAKYERPWALVPLPVQVKVPAVRDRAWPRGPLDRFVLARLEQEKLRPSPEADRVTWLRRVTLDLTGIPPTPREVDAFLGDHSPGAYGRVADRLLASPRYGERMAVPWLDVARYADSYGYQSDQLCPTWPYRDWVVQAFNQNLPYDKFITWQLAGDLLPNATREQRLATAFNRLHRMTNEGGSVPEEWRVEGVADRVKTLGTAFLGMTLECARCHDHKYDPITQRDYYAFGSFFDNIDEYGLYDAADRVPTPSLLLPTAVQEQQETAARGGVSAAEAQFAKAHTDSEQAFLKWLARPDSPSPPDMTGRFDLAQTDGTTLRNLVPGAKANGARSDDLTLGDGPHGKAALFNGDNNISFPAFGRFTRTTPFTIAFWMRDARTTDGAAVVFQACDGTDTGPYGYDLMVNHGQLTARIMRFWPGNAIAVRTRQAVPKDAWTHVAVTYDGSSRAAGLRIYLNGLPADIEIVRDHLYKDTGEHNLVFGARFRDRGFEGGQVADVALFARAVAPVEVAQLADGHSLTDALAHPEAHAAELREYYFSALDPGTRAAAQALTTARARVVAAEDAQFEISVMAEMPQPRPTYVLARGRYDAPVTEADRVGRTLPATIFPFPPTLPRNRLGLAEWLTLPNHPLTARVAVNRIWAMLFGKGLVETTEDFGIQGKLPTHPELLDWLARDFIASGWNVKALVRQIVLSSTYRQASVLRPDLRERDPQNSLLARGPSHRLSAEAVRDTALAAAGLLDERLGGPPVSPYQPGDLWRETNTMSPAYHQSVGTALYRRSLYTVWKRTAPMPNMLAFDAPTREVCTARRQATNTPLQALVLLDDPQFVEAARVLAEHALKEAGPTDAERVRFMFRRLATREPTSEELKLLLTLTAEQRTLFQSGPNDAAQLIHIGDSKPDTALSPVELATATVVAQTILNLDATVWKR
jgi:hypothetical protein